MLSRITVVLLITISTAMADIVLPTDESENFCLDKQTAIDNENLARKHPNDPRFIYLIALRSGLCDLLSKEIIDLDFAIDLFRMEKHKQIMERFEEEQLIDSEEDKIRI